MPNCSQPIECHDFSSYCNLLLITSFMKRGPDLQYLLFRSLKTKRISQRYNLVKGPSRRRGATQCRLIRTILTTCQILTRNSNTKRRLFSLFSLAGRRLISGVLVGRLPNGVHPYSKNASPSNK